MSSSWFDYIKNNIRKPWIFSKISANPNITWDIIIGNPDKPWDYDFVSKNPNINWNIVESNPAIPWSYPSLSENKIDGKKMTAKMIPIENK